MQCPDISELPAPPPDKKGWPWTVATEPQVRHRSPVRVSIVTPSFNSGVYLEETIRSILLQSYPDLEYIVIDGGSTDGSLEILRKYEKWIACWISEPDRGYADALNKGFARATGDIRAWLPASDLYEPSAVYEADAYLGERRYDMIFGRPRFINEQGHQTRVGPLMSRSLRAVSLYGRNNPCQPTTFWRREIHERTGELNANLRYAADSEWFLRLSILGRCRGVPEIVCALRTHAGQLSGNLGPLHEEWFASWDTVVREQGFSRAQLILGALWYVPMMRYATGGWRNVLRVPSWYHLKNTLLRRSGRSPDAPRTDGPVGSAVDGTRPSA